MRLSGRLFTIAMLFELAGCATPVPSPAIAPQVLQAERQRMATIALGSWDEERRRVYLVSQRLLATAYQHGLCSPVHADHGMLLESMADLPPGLAAEVKSTGLRERGLAIVAVAPDSAAAQAGLHAGDVILKWNGETVASGGGLPRNAGEVAQVELEALGGTRKLSLQARSNCDVDVVMDATHDMSAFTSGPNGTIHIAQGMVQALQDDDSLAFVIGHELGHRKHDDSALWRFIDKARSQDQERQADLFGIKLVAAAGYDLHRVLDVWDRLARLDPDRVGQSSLQDHPLRAERNLRLQEAAAEFRQDGKPSTPSQPIIP